MGGLFRLIIGRTTTVPPTKPEPPHIPAKPRPGPHPHIPPPPRLAPCTPPERILQALRNPALAPGQRARIES